MKRFDYNNDDEFQDDLFSDIDDDDDEDVDDEMDAEDYVEIMERREALDVIQLELAELDLKQKLLFKTIKLLEKSFFWKFLPQSFKLSKINKTYNALKEIVNPKESEDA